MVDFNKVYHNSDKFRPAALHFKKCGAFCLAPVGTSEYMEFWDEESRRCLEGYRAPDGDWISGYNYFYLNYCPIQRIVRKEMTNISLEEAYNIDTGKECKELQDIVDTEKYNKIITGLSLKEKEIVSLKIVGELSFKEIARILNEPIGTVQWRYYKALNSLKLMLGNISMFIVTLTLYISSVRNQKRDISKTNTEQSQNNIVKENTTSMSENSKTNDSTDSIQDSQMENKNELSNNINEDVANNVTGQEYAEITEINNQPNNIQSNIYLSLASIFLVLTIIFAIIFTKQRHNR